MADKLLLFVCTVTIVSIVLILVGQCLCATYGDCLFIPRGLRDWIWPIVVDERVDG